MPQQRSFEQATEISEQLVPLYQKLQKDVQTMVQREVAEVAARSEKDIRHALSDLARGGAGGISLPQWSWKIWTGLAATAVLALLLVMRPPSWSISDLFSNAPAVSTVEDGKAGQPDDVVPAQAPDEPEESFAAQAISRYDRLFAAASPRFDVLKARIRAANPSSQELEAALQAWEHKDLSPQERDLVHAAFVQAVLQEQNPNLTIDGDMGRKGCSGRSCGAVRAMWEQDQKTVHSLPAFRTPLTEADLIKVEKFVVYNHLPPAQ
ncbi:MAG: hypothetical protein ACJ8GN_15935 [Longimicrobiaceae bacterium]